jgi:hypothetical protein
MRVLSLSKVFLVLYLAAVFAVAFVALKNPSERRPVEIAGTGSCGWSGLRKLGLRFDSE